MNKVREECQGITLGFIYATFFLNPNCDIFLSCRLCLKKYEPIALNCIDLTTITDLVYHIYASVTFYATNIQRKLDPLTI